MENSRARIYVGSRFSETDLARSPERLERLHLFIERMLKLEICKVGIAVDVEADRSDASGYITSIGDSRVTPIGVSPWGRFVPALNALLHAACVAKCNRILYISTEVDIPGEALDALIAHVDDDTLVAGLHLDGHYFSIGEHPCSGRRSPWNTAALWRVENGLDRIGFPSVGEAFYNDSSEDAGVEEVGAIAVYQSLYNDCGAKLISTPGIHWNYLASSKPAAFAKKLETKEHRSAAQCGRSKLRFGRVRHIAI